MKKLNLLVPLFILILLIPLFSKAENLVRCQECGMMASPEGVFTSYAVNKDGSKSYFCDLGDMIVHVLKKKKTDPESPIFVVDYKSKAIIDGRKAFYVQSKSFKTPMGWGIAAFKDKNDAAAYGNKVSDFAGSLSLLK